MVEMAAKLEDLAKSNLIEHLDIQKSLSDLDDAVQNPQKLLAQTLPLTSKNLFVDSIRNCVYGFKQPKNIS